MANDNELVCGCVVEQDLSGVGHRWQPVAADSLPGRIREEIEGRIIEGGVEEGEIVGNNGIRYRWF